VVAGVRRGLAVGPHTAGAGDRRCDRHRRSVADRAGYDLRLQALAVARRLLTAEERELRDRFRMKRWYTKAFRRRRYFAQIDWLLRQLREVGLDPPDEAVRSFLALMITHDDSFVSHVLARNDLDADFERLRVICAGAIYETYIKACEDAKWPET
jgi:hypothetical protein